jgi:hypothetical protein
MKTQSPPSGPVHTHAGRIAAVSAQQMWKAIRWALARLPYPVEISDGEQLVVTLRLISGRSVTLEPILRTTDDQIALLLSVEGLEEADAAEVAALHENFVANVVYAAGVIYARAKAEA